MKTVLTIIMCATLLSISACTKKESSLPVVGNKAPLFALKDTGERTVKLSDFSGRVVLNGKAHKHEINEQGHA
jgi:hypothetical protein